MMIGFWWRSQLRRDGKESFDDKGMTYELNELPSEDMSAIE